MHHTSMEKARLATNEEDLVEGMGWSYKAREGLEWKIFVKIVFIFLHEMVN